MKFKIGDKVRVARCNRPECFLAAKQIGKTGVIDSVREGLLATSHYTVVIDGDNDHIFGFNDDELEGFSEPGINPCTEIELAYDRCHPQWVSELAWRHVFPADFAAVGYEGTKRLWAHLGNGPREIESAISLINSVRHLYRRSMLDILLKEEGWKLEEITK